MAEVAFCSEVRSEVGNKSALEASAAYPIQLGFKARGYACGNCVAIMPGWSVAERPFAASAARLKHSNLLIY